VVVLVVVVVFTLQGQGLTALVVVPRVDAAALALVRVVVSHGAWDAGGAAAARWALGGDEAVDACLDVVVGHVAAILCLVPDVVALDRGACGLADDFDVRALCIRLLDWVVGARAGAAVDSGARDGVGAREADGHSLEESGEDGDLHCEVEVESFVKKNKRTKKTKRTKRTKTMKKTKRKKRM
jgi:hypothetical protein